MRFGFLIGLVLSVGFLVQCANPIPLEGGHKDEIPPQIDSLRSTINFQTHFQKQDIELTFDEWVQLNNTFQQVVISPAIEPRPNISLRGKTVRLQFDDEVQLRDSVTYTINFGASVQDLTERNAAEDLRFVFSTGDFIDSLEVEGVILDVEKSEPQADILVLLYDNLADSVVRTERPFYFAKTDQNGHFHIHNVRADSFKIFALEDKVPNYKYDDSERIGFLDHPIVVTDSGVQELNLRLFTPELPLQILDIDSVHYGNANILFNQMPRLEDLRINPSDSLEDLLLEVRKDTLKIWYDLEEQTRWQLFLQKDTLWKDTLRIRGNGRMDFVNTARLRPLQQMPATRTHKATKPVDINWNYPLTDFDPSKIRLSLDSTNAPLKVQLTLDTTIAQRGLLIEYAWREDSTYQLTLLPDAVTDIFGTTLKDTLQQRIKILPKDQFGNLLLQVLSLDSTQHYLVEVLQTQNIIASYRVQEKSSFATTLNALSTGAYTVRVVADDNKNGYWDTGNYD
ncbi:MAG: Ig-like domain-containing domain, partial [Bacteroidota bacterium]